MTRASRKPGDSINWAEAHQRLATARQTVTATDSSPERTRAILDERARLLARKPTDPEAAGETIEVLTFMLGAERYAIQTEYVREAVRLLHLTPVPGAPIHVAGVTNYRGDVLCIIDLRPFLQAPATGLTDLSRIIVLGTQRVEFGLLADQADDIRRVPTSEIVGLAGRHAPSSPDYLLGVTRDALTVLDGAVLLNDPGLFIDHAGPG